MPALFTQMSIRPKVAHRVLGERLHLFVTSDVDEQRRCTLPTGAEFARCFLHSLRRACTDHDGCSCRGICLGDRVAKAARAAGHHGYFACQF